METIRYQKRLVPHVQAFNAGAREVEKLVAAKHAATWDEKNDPLWKEVWTHHVERQNQKMLKALVAVLRHYHVRFFSIAPIDLICLEDVRLQDNQCITPWIAHTVFGLENLLSSPPQNRQHASVRLNNWFLQEKFGAYDLRENRVEKVALYLTLNSTWEDPATRTFGVDTGDCSVREWLGRSGACGSYFYTLSPGL